MLLLLVAQDQLQPRLVAQERPGQPLLQLAQQWPLPQQGAQRQTPRQQAAQGQSLSRALRPVRAQRSQQQSAAALQFAEWWPRMREARVAQRNHSQWPTAKPKVEPAIMMQT